MVSTRQKKPVAAPLAAPEDACQRAQAKYTQPVSRARIKINAVSRQTQAAQQLILNWFLQSQARRASSRSSVRSTNLSGAMSYFTNQKTCSVWHRGGVCDLQREVSVGTQAARAERACVDGDDASSAASPTAPPSGSPAPRRRRRPSTAENLGMCWARTGRKTVVPLHRKTELTQFREGRMPHLRMQRMPLHTERKGRRC